MEKQCPDQKYLWGKQHLQREQEFIELENVPNGFAKKCIGYLPENATVLEVGAANGRDARSFAKEKKCLVYATDFALSALQQLQKARETDKTTGLVHPFSADTKDLPLNAAKLREFFDAVYARSALHLSDEQLDKFLSEVKMMLKPRGFLMVEGKPRDDFKIQRSREVSPNLVCDHDGHLRRLWSEENIKRIIDDMGLKLLCINCAEEEWRGKKTKFINFIAQKYENEQ